MSLDCDKREEGDDSHKALVPSYTNSAKRKKPSSNLPKRKRIKKSLPPLEDPALDPDGVEPDSLGDSNDWIHMTTVLSEGKKKLQSSEQKNGVTFAFIGASGCGKSTLIRKVFVDQVFTKMAKEQDNKEFIIQIFTESSKSDAFNGLAKDKSILLDCKGLDEDNINWCYHMNERYDKKYNFMMILDDVIDIQYKKLVRRMFLIMRNTNISSLVSLQYPNLIPKSVRSSVYFTILFYFPTDECIELIVKGWLSAYLPGKNLHEKMLHYRSWNKGEDGHRMFLIDNLNHKAYYVNGSYMCKEMELICKNTSSNSSSDVRKTTLDYEEEKEDDND